jgi:hypothetical protein
MQHPMAGRILHTELAIQIQAARTPSPPLILLPDDLCSVLDAINSIS